MKMLLNSSLMNKILIARTFKNVVQPNMPMLEEINFENDNLAMLRPPAEGKPTSPTLAGDPRAPTVPHQKIREDVFEKWSRSSKCDRTRRVKSTILS